MADQYLDGKKIVKIDMISNKTQKELYIDGQILHLLITLEDGTVFKVDNDSLDEWRE